MEPERTGARRSGSSGTNGGHRAAAHFSPGAFRLGEVHPQWGTGRAGFLRQVGRAVRGPGGPEGRASGAQPPAPESTFDASPAPHDKMATWAEGEPGPRGWGKERGGEKRQKQKGGPRNAEAGPRARGGGRAGAPAHNAAGGRDRLTFSCRSRRRRPPWRIGPRDAFSAGGPQARSGLSAGSLRTRGEKERLVQRCEAGNPS